MWFRGCCEEIGLGDGVEVQGMSWRDQGMMWRDQGIMWRGQEIAGIIGNDKEGTGDACGPASLNSRYTSSTQSASNILYTIPSRAKFEGPFLMFAFAEVPSKCVCYDLVKRKVASLPFGLISRARACTSN